MDRPDTERQKGKGRPRIEWEDHLENITKKRGKTLMEVKKLAKDREKFRRWIDPTLKGKRER